MEMPASVYWKMRLWNYQHSYIVGVNDIIVTYTSSFASGIIESNWHGIIDTFHNNNSLTIEDVMNDFVAAYGIE
jgi:hypothetical protein